MTSSSALNQDVDIDISNDKYSSMTYQDLCDTMTKKLKEKGTFRILTMDEVKTHNHKDSGWIVVDKKVYDITHHVLTHEGWVCGCASSTLLAILRTLGTDCTAEVLEVHSERALKQLQIYLIGGLEQ